MLVTLCEIGEMYLRLLGTNDFPVKAGDEKFAAAGSLSKISFGRLRRKIARKSTPNM